MVGIDSGKVFDETITSQLFPLFYPARKRWHFTYCVVRNDDNGNMYITDEYGEMSVIEYGSDMYATLVEYVLGGRVLLWRNMSDGAAIDDIVRNALEDKHAKVMVTKRGVCGVCWFSKSADSKTRRRGAIVSGACWNIETDSDSEYIASIRRFVDDMQLGDHFSLSALGYAHLSAYWQRKGIRRERTTPNGMRLQMAQYTIGGRSETAVSRDDIIEYASELDLKSAYTTAAKLLPMGRRVYVSPRVDVFSDEVKQRYSAIYGKWHIKYTRDLQYSPVPKRNDNFKNMERINGDYILSWNVRADDEYDYCGWSAEIEALCNTGAAIVTWHGGYGWCTLSDDLAEWVDSLWSLRAQYKANGDTQLESFAKMLGNAVIGRLGMTGSVSIVTRKDAQDGDRVWIPRGANGFVRDWGTSSDDASTESDNSDYIEGSLFIHSDPYKQPRIATPVHLLSYIQMSVRMEVYRQLHAQRIAGKKLVATNVDSCWIGGDYGDNVATPQYTPHDWRWIMKRRRKLRVVYNRGFVYLDSDTMLEQSKLPGLMIQKPEVRQRILSNWRELARVDRVEHRRKQRETAKATQVDNASPYMR